MQIEADQLRYVIATTKEKPYDDIRDYKADLSEVYRLKLRKMKDPANATRRVMKNVRGKFTLE